MSDGDSIQAGHITTAYTTTDVVAEQQREGLGGFGRKDFQGNVIFSVGPTNITSDGLQPDGALDGIQGAGNRGGGRRRGVFRWRPIFGHRRARLWRSSQSILAGVESGRGWRQRRRRRRGRR